MVYKDQREDNPLKKKGKLPFHNGAIFQLQEVIYLTFVLIAFRIMIYKLIVLHIRCLVFIIKSIE